MIVSSVFKAVATTWQHNFTLLAHIKEQYAALIQEYIKHKTDKSFEDHLERNGKSENLPLAKFLISGNRGLEQSFSLFKVGDSFDKNFRQVFKDGLIRAITNKEPPNLPTPSKERKSQAENIDDSVLKEYVVYILKEIKTDMEKLKQEKGNWTAKHDHVLDCIERSVQNESTTKDSEFQLLQNCGEPLTPVQNDEEKESIPPLAPKAPPRQKRKKTVKAVHIHSESTNENFLRPKEPSSSNIQIEQFGLSNPICIDSELQKKGKIHEGLLEDLKVDDAIALLEDIKDAREARINISPLQFRENDTVIIEPLTEAATDGCLPQRLLNYEKAPLPMINKKDSPASTEKIRKKLGKGRLKKLINPFVWLKRIQIPFIKRKNKDNSSVAIAKKEDFLNLDVDELRTRCHIVMIELRELVNMEDDSMTLCATKEEAEKISQAEDIIRRNEGLITATKEKLLSMELPTAEGKRLFLPTYPRDAIPEHLKRSHSQISTKADGSCFYRAMSLALTGVDDYVQEMKLITLDWMVKNRNTIEPKATNILNITYEELFNKALQYSAYAEDYHIAAWSVNMGIPIHFHQSIAIQPLIKFGERNDIFESVYPIIRDIRRPPILVQHVAAGRSENYTANHYIPLLPNENVATVKDNSNEVQSKSNCSTGIIYKKNEPAATKENIVSSSKEFVSSEKDPLYPEHDTAPIMALKDIHNYDVCLCKMNKTNSEQNDTEDLPRNCIAKNILPLITTQGFKGFTIDQTKGMWNRKLRKKALHHYIDKQVAMNKNFANFASRFCANVKADVTVENDKNITATKWEDSLRRGGLEVGILQQLHKIDVCLCSQREKHNRTNKNKIWCKNREILAKILERKIGEECHFSISEIEQIFGHNKLSNRRRKLLYLKDKVNWKLAAQVPPRVLKDVENLKKEKQFQQNNRIHLAKDKNTANKFISDAEIYDDNTSQYNSAYEDFSEQESLQSSSRKEELEINTEKTTAKEISKPCFNEEILDFRRHVTTKIGPWCKSYYIDIPKEKWQKCYDNTSKVFNVSKFISDILNSNLHKHHPDCNFSRRREPRFLKKRNVWKMEGYCSFNHGQCSKFWIFVRPSVTNTDNIKAQVFEMQPRNHTINEGEDFFSLPIRGLRRDEEKMKLKEMPPTRWEMEYQKENRGHYIKNKIRNVGIGVSKTMKYEKRQSERRSKDDYTDLLLLQKEKPDYIRWVSQPNEPFGFLLISKESQDLAIPKIVSQGGIEIQMDATGSLIRKQDGSNGPIYVYNCLSSQPSEVEPRTRSFILPQSCAVESRHTAEQIRNHILTLKTDLMEAGKDKGFFEGHEKIVSRFNSDFSYAIINAAVGALNDPNDEGNELTYMTLKEYLVEINKVMLGQVTPEDSKIKCLVTVCNSHLMKSFSRLLTKHKIKGPQKTFAMHALARMIKCKDEESFLDIFEKFVTVLQSEKTSENITNYHKEIVGKKQLISLYSVDRVIEDTVWESPYENDEKNTAATLADCSPIALTMKNIRDSVTQSHDCSKSQCVTECKNELQNIEILELFTKYYIPVVPLWSNFAIKTYNPSWEVKTQGTIENFYFQVKQNRRYSKSSPGEFIVYFQDLENHLNKKYLQEKYHIKKERRKGNRKRPVNKKPPSVVAKKKNKKKDELDGDDPDPKERWRKGRRLKKGVYGRPYRSPCDLEKSHFSENEIENNCNEKTEFNNNEDVVQENHARLIDQLSDADLDNVSTSYDSDISTTHNDLLTQDSDIFTEDEVQQILSQVESTQENSNHNQTICKDTTRLDKNIKRNYNAEHITTTTIPKQCEVPCAVVESKADGDGDLFEDIEAQELIENEFWEKIDKTKDDYVSYVTDPLRQLRENQYAVTNATDIEFQEACNNIIKDLDKISKSSFNEDGQLIKSAHSEFISIRSRINSQYAIFTDNQVKAINDCCRNWMGKYHGTFDEQIRLHVTYFYNTAYYLCYMQLKGITDINEAIMSFYKAEDLRHKLRREKHAEVIKAMELCKSKLKDPKTIASADAAIGVVKAFF